MGTAQSVFTGGGGLKWPNTAGQYSFITQTYPLMLYVSVSSYRMPPGKYARNRSDSLSCTSRCWMGWPPSRSSSSIVLMAATPASSYAKPFLMIMHLSRLLYYPDKSAHFLPVPPPPPVNSALYIALWRVQIHHTILQSIDWLWNCDVCRFIIPSCSRLIDCGVGMYVDLSHHPAVDWLIDQTTVPGMYFRPARNAHEDRHDRAVRGSIVTQGKNHHRVTSSVFILIRSTQ